MKSIGKFKMKEKKLRIHPVRVWRASQGLSQKKLARLIGYQSQSIIHAIETYKLDPKISEIKKLCDLSEGILTPWDFLEKD